MMRQSVMGALVGPLVLTGCATTPCAVESHTPGVERVSVRFTTPAETAQFAARFNTQSDVQLASHGSPGVVHDGTAFNDWSGGPAAFRAVMWGGNFSGTDVTHESTPLQPGQYMFGLFDEQNGAAYQGWLNVNSGDNDYIDLLREWRNTVHAQKVWLGYDRKLDGQFASTEADHFKGYAKQIRAIKKLEKRINDAIETEKKDRARQIEQYGRLFDDTQVLLTPSAIDFSHPSTRPALSQVELDRVSGGRPLTKIVTVADYAKAGEKLRRVNDLRRELKRNRNVFEEEVKRLQRRKRFYVITDHIYKHDKAFVVNERRLQNAIGVVDKLDQQLEDHRHRAYALAFVTGLFAPDVTQELFDQEEQDLRHDRVVLEERMRQLNHRFDRIAVDSGRRVNVESDRQRVAAAIADVDRQMNRIESSRVAINTLRDSSNVIHRKGSASVITASIFDGSLPTFVADAIERESLMTIRLQGSGTQSGYAKSYSKNKNVNKKSFGSNTTKWTGSPMMGSPVTSAKPKSNGSVARKASAPSPKPNDYKVRTVWEPTRSSARTPSYSFGEYPPAKRIEPAGGDTNEGVLWDDCCLDTLAAKKSTHRSTLASNVAKPAPRKNVTTVSAPRSRPVRTTKNSSILVGEYPSAQRVEPIGGAANDGVLWDDCCIDDFVSGPKVQRKTLASKVSKPDKGKARPRAPEPALLPSESGVIYIPAHPELLEEPGK